MARKTLLTEGEIRQFIKLANLTNVSDHKIQEMYGGDAYGRDEEDMMEPGPEQGPEELDMAVADADDELASDEMEMGAEDEMEGGSADLDVSEREALMADVVAAVAQALGIEDRVDVASSEDDGDDMGMDDMGMDDMGMDDDGMGSLEEPDLGAPEGGDEESLADEEEEDEEGALSQSDIVAEVARRVATRLKKENKREVMVDTLAERIMQRLSKIRT
tara:strand:- start:1528 stop:2181 length:654 start_codon:yes stop_codon:yes gene_type:complete